MLRSLGRHTRTPRRRRARVPFAQRVDNNGLRAEPHRESVLAREIVPRLAVVELAAAFLEAVVGGGLLAELLLALPLDVAVDVRGVAAAVARRDVPGRVRAT